MYFESKQKKRDILLDQSDFKYADLQEEDEMLSNIHNDQNTIQTQAATNIDLRQGNESSQFGQLNNSLDQIGDKIKNGQYQINYQTYDPIANQVGLADNTSAITYGSLSTNYKSKTSKKNTKNKSCKQERYESIGNKSIKVPQSEGRKNKQNKEYDNPQILIQKMDSEQAYSTPIQGSKRKSKSTTKNSSAFKSNNLTPPRGSSPQQLDTSRSQFQTPAQVKKQQKQIEQQIKKQKRAAEKIFNQEYNDKLTGIDFNATEGSNNDFLSVLNRQQSLQTDIIRLQTPTQDNELSAKKVVKKKSENGAKQVPLTSMYTVIKEAAAKRYRPKSNAYIRYYELAIKYLMSIQVKPELKLNFDLIQKSESKIFGQILTDFIIIENIALWSDVVSVCQLDKREGLVHIPQRYKQEWEKTKLSQNYFENKWFMKGFSEHISTSQKLQHIQLVGLKLCRNGYRYLANAIEQSMTLRIVVVQSCNVATSDFLHVITEGIMNSKSLQTLDLQCNDLSDKHVSSIVKVICAQYELRDQLRYKLSLRQPKTLDVSKLGLKQLILSRNEFGDKFCEQMSIALKADEYLKNIQLNKNKINVNGFKYLAESCFQHPGLLSINLRNNPGYDRRETSKFKKIMKDVFYQNLKHEIEESFLSGNRLNINWLCPDSLGLTTNSLDLISNQIPSERRKDFVEVISNISKTLKIKWIKVLRAFIGEQNQDDNQILHLQKQLVSLRRHNRSRPQSQMSHKTTKLVERSPIRSPKNFSPKKDSVKASSKSGKSPIRKQKRSTTAHKTQNSNTDKRSRMFKSTFSQFNDKASEFLPLNSEISETTHHTRKLNSRNHAKTQKKTQDLPYYNNLISSEQNLKSIDENGDIEKLRLQMLSQQSLELANQVLLLTKENQMLKQNMMGQNYNEDGESKFQKLQQLMAQSHAQAYESKKISKMMNQYQNTQDTPHFSTHKGSRKSK